MAIGVRLLLERSGSYPAIEAAVASGELQDLLPVALVDHVGSVYRRLEQLADARFPGMAALRLATLLHETPPDSLSLRLAALGFSDFAPVVLGVIGGFGGLWKARADREVADYVAAHQAHLAPLLLFELAHEGRATPAMERAAELGGLDRGFRRWAGRLPTGVGAAER